MQALGQGEASGRERAGGKSSRGLALHASTCALYVHTEPHTGFRVSCQGGCGWCVMQSSVKIYSPPLPSVTRYAVAGGRDCVYVTYFKFARPKCRPGSRGLFAEGKSTSAFLVSVLPGAPLKFASAAAAFRVGRCWRPVHSHLARQPRFHRAGGTR